LNTLPPEWSKFVTDVKLVRDVHTTNIDQFHEYLRQHEVHANEYGSPYQSQQYSSNQTSIPLSITHPSNDYQPSVHHNAYSPPSSIPQIAYVPTVNQHQQQPEFPSLDSGLTVSVFKQELRYNQFRGDKFLLLRVQVEPTVLEQVEAILRNKGLLFVTTVKGKDICPNSALNLRGNGMIRGLRIKCC
nr:hypothetical protein [Tanacetum cinerariifolium]